MEFHTIAVVGAGFMGTGIAESAAGAGVSVHLYEPGQAALDRSRGTLKASVDRSVARGRIAPAEADATLGRIMPTTSLEDLAPAQVVIEAVVEDPAIKGDVFRTLDQAAPDAQILASNTSSIPIAQLASGTTRPERVCGLHFFSPVPAMRLVEVVLALDTAPHTASAAERFVQQIGKRSIRTKDRSGFIVNMLLVPYLTAAVRMVEEGFAAREDIDDGMTLGAGHPMGPLRLCDLIGLDVLYAVCDSLYDEFKRPEYAPPPLMKRMVAAGRLGRKTGRGFYPYAKELS